MLHPQCRSLPATALAGSDECSCSVPALSISLMASSAISSSGKSVCRILFAELVPHTESAWPHCKGVIVHHCTDQAMC